MKVIAVYGSSQITPNDPEYAVAREVGYVLGKAGYAVMTGGYKGVMSAASEGAALAGAHVIGVTTAAIEAIAPQRANQWVREEIHYHLFSERLAHLVRHADGYVAMHGGIGTLHEVVNVWELIRVNEIPRRPIICYGEFWQELLRPIMTNKYVHPDYQQLIHFADSPQDVLAILEQYSVEAAQ